MHRPPLTAGPYLFSRPQFFPPPFLSLFVVVVVSRLTLLVSAFVGSSVLGSQNYLSARSGLSAGRAASVYVLPSALRPPRIADSVRRSPSPPPSSVRGFLLPRRFTNLDAPSYTSSPPPPRARPPTEYIVRPPGPAALSLRVRIANRGGGTDAPQARAEGPKRGRRLPSLFSLRESERV